MKFKPSYKVDLEKVNSVISQPLNNNIRVKTDFWAANAYPPFIYFPQAIGIWFARLLNLPPIIIYYMGRFANYLIWILLALAALRITPVYKWVFLILLFLPMSFYQAISLSPDAMTNASAFLFAAVLLRCASDETPIIQRNNFLQLLGVSILLALIKIPYFVLTLAIFIIPWKKFGTKRQYVSTIALLIGAVAVMVLLANWSSLFSFLSYDQVRKVPPFHQRLSEILSNPIDFINILNNTFNIYANSYYQSYLGILGWLDTPLSSQTYTVISLTLAINILTNGSCSFSINIKNRIWIGILSLGVMLIILLLLYFSYTPEGAKAISGFQGRYLIPIGALFSLLFYNQKLRDLGKYVRWLSLVYLVWLFISVAYIIAIRFYAIS